MSELDLLPGEQLDEVNFQIRLIQKADGLHFGTDALLLASYIKQTPAATAVEFGGGSGIISLLCLSRKKVARVACVEVQEAYASLIGRNAALNGFSEAMRAVCCDVRQFAVRGEEQGKADVVFTNPPYMKSTAGAPNGAEEKNIARHEVLGDIFDFCAAAARLLRFGGRFYCVYRPDRMADLLYALRANKLEPKRLTLVHADAQTEPSMLLVEAVSGGKCGLCVTRPLLVYQQQAEGKRVYTADMVSVMENGVLPQATERG